MAYLLPHLLTESAVRFPEKEAMRFRGEMCTYGELDLLTNRVARALQAAGAKRGDRIGIYLHKSVASVVSVFAIGKAQAVYVPLDPNAPAKRLAYIAQNCSINFVLTSTEKLPALAQLVEEGVPVKAAILTDGNPYTLDVLPASVKVISWQQVQAEDASPLPNRTTETDLAYVLYTSGSTGEPKGVMISHRTIFTFINWCYEKFRMTQDDRVTSHAPLHFDLSTFDIYVTVKAGGTVVLVPETLSVFPVQLVRLLQDERVTVTYLVPSILALMVNYGELGRHDLSALRAVLFAGEVLPIKYLRKLVQANPQADYYNLYGPTETNVCTYYKVTAEDVGPDRVKSLPIGMACENIEVFAVDPEGRLVTQPGQEGELWARGSCVAQGYWGDQERTAKVFVRNPFQGPFEEVAYRTGDVVMLDEDGVNWLYLGRRDHMIKSRGHRIELGEIECVLNNHEAIKESAVVASPDDLIGNRIKAFVALSAAARSSEKELQAYCAKYLPAYMLPEQIEIRESLPKTSTGKIDRLALAQS